MEIGSKTKVEPYLECSGGGILQLNTKFNIQLYKEIISFYSKKTGILIPCVVPFSFEEEALNIPQLLQAFYEKFGDITIDTLLCKYEELGITHMRDLRALCYATSVAYRYLTPNDCKEERLVGFLKSMQGMGEDVMLTVPLVFIAKTNGREHIVLERLVFLEYKSLLELLFAAHVYEEDKQLVSFFLLKESKLLEFFKATAKLPIQQNFKLYQWLFIRIARVDAELLYEKSIFRLFNLLKAFVLRTLTKNKVAKLAEYGFGEADIAYLYYSLAGFEFEDIPVKEAPREKALSLIVSILVNSRLYHNVVEELLCGNPKLPFNYSKEKLFKALRDTEPMLRCDYEWLYGVMQRDPKFKFAECKSLQFIFNKDTCRRFTILKTNEQIECLAFTFREAASYSKKPTADYIRSCLDDEYLHDILQNNYIPSDLFVEFIKYGYVELDEKDICSVHPETITSLIREGSSDYAAKILGLLFAGTSTKKLHDAYQGLFWHSTADRYRHSPKCIYGTWIPLQDVSKSGCMRKILEKTLEFLIRYVQPAVPGFASYVLEHQEAKDALTQEEVQGFLDIVNDNTAS